MRKVVILATAIVLAASSLTLAERGRAATRAPDHARMPELRPVVGFGTRTSPAATRTIADVDLLADGRILVLDFDAKRVAVFGVDGEFEMFLNPPPGISPEDTLIPRLVALPDGGVVLADNRHDRFFFYDKNLQPKKVVPMGHELLSLNGFVRHPSGDLYVVAFCRENNKILHRFDSEGEYLGSSVEALDVGFFEKYISSGLLVVDPDDGTLWLSRLTPYEILHLTPEGEQLGRMGRDVPGFQLPVAERQGGLVRVPRHTSSSKIAVIDGLVVNSYIFASGRRGADVFRKDGTTVATELGPDSPLTFAKTVGKNTFLRHFNGETPTVELWVNDEN
jgi:hypothetical protein